MASFFTTRSNGTYWYSRGWNWRAYAAYFAGIVPVFPGFLANVGVKGVPIGAQRLYVFALPVGICVSAFVYWGLCVWSPVEGMARSGTQFENQSGQSEYDYSTAVLHRTPLADDMERKI